MGSGKSFRFVTVSTLIHTGCVLALLLAPAMKPEPNPIGTDGSATVEFEASPLGNQTEVVTKGVEETVPAPAPVVEKKEEVVKIAKPKAEKPAPKIATELPPKEVVEEVQEAPVMAAAPVVEEVPENIEPEIAEATPEEVPAVVEEAPVAEEIPVVEEAPPVVEEQKLAKEEMLPVEETPQVVEETPEVAMMAAEDLKAETADQSAAPVSNEEPSQGAGTDQIVLGDTAPASAAATQFGTSEGVRNYEDLSQVPGNKLPQYPEQARLRRQEGQVVLQYFVTASGQVSNMKMVKSSGSQLLDQEALNSVSQFKYRPGQQGWTVHPVNFSLKGPEQKMGGRLRTSTR